MEKANLRVDQAFIFAFTARELRVSFVAQPTIWPTSEGTSLYPLTSLHNVFPFSFAIFVNCLTFPFITWVTLGEMTFFLLKFPYLQNQDEKSIFYK